MSRERDYRRHLHQAVNGDQLAAEAARYLRTGHARLELAEHLRGEAIRDHAASPPPPPAGRRRPGSAVAVSWCVTIVFAGIVWGAAAYLIVRMVGG